MEGKSPDLIKRMRCCFQDLSRCQKLIANYIINHYDKAAFMTAAKLGEAAGVSESTVVRFAIEMGFDGYPELQKALQELIKSKLTIVQRMEVSSNRINENDVLRSVLQLDMNKIKKTLDEIDQDSFNKIIETILNAKRIYILGVRSSSTLASFLGFYFNLIFDNVKLINTTGVSEMFEQILRISEGDVLIGISFPRYSKRTVKALQYAKKQKAAVIALTDSYNSPLVAYANHSLIARSDMAFFADSLVAPLSVINAIIAAVGMRKKDEFYDTFGKLEKIWDEYQVYDKDDNFDVFEQYKGTDI